MPFLSPALKRCSFTVTGHVHTSFIRNTGCRKPTYAVGSRTVKVSSTSVTRQGSWRIIPHTGSSITWEARMHSRAPPPLRDGGKMGKRTIQKVLSFVAKRETSSVWRAQTVMKKSSYFLNRVNITLSVSQTVLAYVCWARTSLALSHCKYFYQNCVKKLRMDLVESHFVLPASTIILI